MTNKLFPVVGVLEPANTLKVKSPALLSMFPPEADLHTVFFNLRAAPMQCTSWIAFIFAFVKRRPNYFV